MSIPEDQLETWSHQGSVTQSSDTYRPIKAAMETETAPYANKPFQVFLQGSYGNSTNIFSESDVDIVMCLGSVFHHDLDFLDEDEKRAFAASHHDSDYRYSNFRNDVQVALQEQFANVVSSNKAIKVTGYGARRDADVIAAMEYRRYYMFSSQSDFAADTGICFFANNGAFIINFPKQHLSGCTAKHQATSAMFKPLIRIFKNMRRHLVDAGSISRDVAPGYFIECLLYNVPDVFFRGTYSEACRASLQWLLDANRNDFDRPDRQAKLFGDRIVPSWDPTKCDQFLGLMVALWNDW
jgi:hypothetical protein